MRIDKTRCQGYLKDFNFSSLFIEELGWDRYQESLHVHVNEEDFTLNAIAEKRGLVVLRCTPPAGIPPYPTRRKIDTQVTKTHHEHLIIFTDPGESMQVWQWVRREIGRPTACRERTFHKNQTGEALLQKLDWLAFSLEEEGDLTIVDVTSRVRAGLDVERVTRRFYDAFKKERDAFEKFLSGIPDDNLQRWYVSVMLNRLMFIYFVQKKGFLDGNHDYLRKQLERSSSGGADQYYREFLCPLFFEGFARKEAERTPAINHMLGKVPYLNGGLFLRHQVEELHGEHIQIPDAAFQRLFAFFDRYQWHLDERPLRRDDEINPDVLGYIFEKYINQKQMGAYYTKEDITEYISKNTIMPHLLETVRHANPSAFDRHAWALLQTDPDRYIYPAVRKGMELPLPQEIEAGLKEVSQRGGWNRPALPEYALPTEIWREVVARRQRYHEVLGKIEKGEIHEINNLITYNLDIRQFAQDLIESLENPELLRAFWKALNDIKVLDPTVGSGAFLFAALNILEPLYEACLERMGVFLEELDASGEAHRPEKLKDFRQARAQVEQHPNQRYFILKSIIVNNLYGVDIMDEAVEICKLRLFLKLVAQVDNPAQIEPLPDIDFNVRAGNTLVGFVTLEEVRRAITMGKTRDGVTQDKLFALDEDQKTLIRVQQQAEDIERLFKRFRQQQTELGGEITPQDKAQLKNMLKVLEDELNRYLAREYAIHNPHSEAYRKWLNTHKPFHWVVEFFGIMNEGGFDVVIGNPPYLNLAGFKEYEIIGYSTRVTGNLYPIVLERGQNLGSEKGRQGYIVPISSTATEGYLPLQKILLKRELFVSCYDDRPAHLFNDLDKNTLSIILVGNKAKNISRGYSTRLCRWSGDERTNLFTTLAYQPFQESNLSGCIAKIGSPVEKSIWQKIWAKNKYLASFYSKYGQHSVFYSRKINAFLQVLDFTPEVRNGKGNLRPPSEFKEISVETESTGKSVYCCLSSSLFRWYVDVTTDGSHLNKREIDNYPFDPLGFQSEHSNVLDITRRLSKYLRDNSEIRIMKYA
jgi:hypothetical protein